MSNPQLYLFFWKKKLPLIKAFLDSDSYFSSVQFLEADFLEIEKRLKYSFNLEYNNGSVINKQEISAVANDLNTAISENKDLMYLIDSGHFHFKMTSSFVFKMSKLT